MKSNPMVVATHIPLIDILCLDIPNIAVLMIAGESRTDVHNVLWEAPTVRLVSVNIGNHPPQTRNHNVVRYF